MLQKSVGGRLHPTRISKTENYIRVQGTGLVVHPEDFAMTSPSLSLVELLSDASGVCSHIIGRDSVQTRETLSMLKNVRGTCQSLRHIESLAYSHSALDRLYSRTRVLDGELTRLTHNNVLSVYRFANMSGLQQLVSDMRMHMAFKEIETKLFLTIYSMLKTLRSSERMHLASQMLTAGVMTAILEACRVYSHDTTIQIMGIILVKIISFAGPKHEVLDELTKYENITLLDNMMLSLDSIDAAASKELLDDILSARRCYCRIYEFLFADARAPVFSTERDSRLINTFVCSFVHWTTLGLELSYLRKYTKSMSNILENVSVDTLFLETRLAVLTSLANM